MMDSVQVTNVIIHAHDFNLPLASFSPTGLWSVMQWVLNAYMAS